MKTPRFLTEFASWQKKQFQGNELMRPEIKAYGLKEIETALQLYERGMLTIHEAVDTINDPFRRLSQMEDDIMGQDMTQEIIRETYGENAYAIGESGNAIFWCYKDEDPANTYRIHEVN